MREAGGSYNPLPVDQALAYILEVLPAFQYLHDLGLVYCDFKPDNLIQIGDAVKLIDLGGVRRLDDEESAIYGTVGYQAPEVRAGRHHHRLRHLHHRPHAGGADGGVPRLPDHLRRQACRRWRRRRSSSRTTRSTGWWPRCAPRTRPTGSPRSTSCGSSCSACCARWWPRSRPAPPLTSAASVLFEAPAVVSDALAWDQLPALRVDTTDGQFAWLCNITADDPKERLAELQQAPAITPEVQLARARAALQAGWDTPSTRWSTRCSPSTRGSGGRSG